MLNNLVVWNRIGKEGTQHAYFPGRGVHTAWVDVFERIESPYIYEFDLKGFFDSVSLEYITKLLTKVFNLPRKEAAFFRKLNRSIVRLCAVDKIDEPDRALKYTANLQPNPNLKRAPVGLDPNWDGVIPPELDLSGRNRRPAVLEVDGFELVGASKPGLGWKENGVPQGAATSCSLSTIALDSVTSPDELSRSLGGASGLSVVMYADDGIIFAQNEEDVNRALSLFNPTGVSVNESKSQWVKKGGAWLTDLKFLGITYSGLNETIKASTRKGATLEFGIKDQFLAFLLERRENILLGGSASHLNGLKSYRGVSVKS
jgi:hypothetical protein